MGKAKIFLILCGTNIFHPAIPIEATYSGIRKLCFLLTVLIGLLIPFAIQADVYKFVDKNGDIYFTDKPKSTKYKLIIRTKRKSKSLQSMLANQKKFAPIIQAAAKKHELDPDLLNAVIRVESAFNPNAVSKKGAVGLMQLMPKTAERYGVEDRRNPAENINGGANYLSMLMGMFKSDVRLAVAAYNAGENAVIKYGYQVPPYRETQNYVTRVLGLYNP